MRNGIALSIVILATATLTGCKAKPPQPVAVRGQLLDAKEQGIENVIVRFVSPNPGEPAVDSVTQSDGAFTLTCRPGTYRVLLMTVPTIGVQSGRGGRPRVMSNLDDIKKQQDAKKEHEDDPEPEATPAPKQKDNRFADRYSDPALTPWQNVQVQTATSNAIRLVITEDTRADQ